MMKYNSLSFAIKWLAYIFLMFYNSNLNNNNDFSISINLSILNRNSSYADIGNNFRFLHDGLYKAYHI